MIAISEKTGSYEGLVYLFWWTKFFSIVMNLLDSLPSFFEIFPGHMMITWKSESLLLVFQFLAKHLSPVHRSEIEHT